jgi:hypothetical protein
VATFWGGSLLGLIADALKAVPNPVLIDGYTDSVPISTPLYPSNLELSSARADRVAEYFISNGLAESRMFPEGLGAREPIMSDATPAGRARNRRVEIIVQSAVVNQTLANAGLDQTLTTVPAPVPRPVRAGVTTGVAPSNANISPHLGANERARCGSGRIGTSR